MAVQVSITAATATNAILVPKASVLESPEAGSFVMLAGKDGLAHQTPVQLGLRGAVETQIIKGVSAGNSVIVSGAYGLPDKTKIKIEAPAQSTKEDNSDKTGEKSPSGSEKE